MGTEIKLTKKQKIDILKWVIKKLLKEREGYICVIIKAKMCRKFDLDYSEIDVFYFFPELRKYKPQNTGEAWFCIFDYKPRVEILNNVIKDIENGN